MYFSFRNRNRIHIAYRLYQSQSDIIVNNETIKQRITIQDIYDVIDTVLLNYPGIEVIGFQHQELLIMDLLQLPVLMVLMI